MPRTVDDYLALITSYHRGKPKFSATVAALTKPLADLQAFIASIPAQFDLETAIGAQLDVVGEWVGRSRFIKTPAPNLYFSFDVDGKGWDEGFWDSPYDGDQGITRLDDDTYRLLLRAKIAANNWDGTVAGAAAALEYIFADSGSLVFIVDNQDMTMTVGVSQHIPSLLFLALLAGGYIPLKPEGVRVDYEIVSEEATPMFGFDVDNEYIGGWDVGSWGVSPEYFTS